jgi:hypothetical protein
MMIGLVRMKRILEINTRDSHAIVGPGVVNLWLTRALAGKGFHYAPTRRDLLGLEDWAGGGSFESLIRPMVFDRLVEEYEETRPNNRGSRDVWRLVDRGVRGEATVNRIG